MNTSNSASNTKPLSGKVCVIVGGNGCIGESISRECALQGAQVVVVGRDLEKGKALTTDIEQQGGTAEFKMCDVTNETDVVSLVKEIHKQHGRVDGLVLTAHFTNGKQGKPLFETEYADFRSYTDMHLGSSFLLVREFGKKMVEQKNGSMVLFGSVYGSTAPDFEIFEGTTQTVRPEYVTAKGALISFMTYCAKYLGAQGVRVNMVSSGAVNRGEGESVVSGYVKDVILGKRLAEPEDISPLVSLLLSDSTGYITGQNITVDGGWSL